MGCACNRPEFPEQAIDRYWETLKLRKKSYHDILEIIRTKKQSETENIKPNKFLILIQDLIAGEDYQEETQHIFEEGLKLAREQQNEGLLFLSILLLGTGTKEELVQSFLSLAMTQGGFKKYIQILPKENKNLIQRLPLEQLMKFYVNFISLFCVPFLSHLFEGSEKEWKNILLKKFSDLRQENIVINEMIFKNFESQSNINIEEFLLNLAQFSDKTIRMALSTTPEQNKASQ